ncbi:MAG: hypothetical protein AB2693_32795 [Candidatus Thiodiazotropha sp.]
MLTWGSVGGTVCYFLTKVDSFCAGLMVAVGYTDAAESVTSMNVLNGGMLLEEDRSWHGLESHTITGLT